MMSLKLYGSGSLLSQDNFTSLDKEQTSYSDSLDALRLSCKM
jgi:hypothetical protein